MKTQTWIFIGTPLLIIAGACIYLYNAASKAERLATATEAERGWVLIEDNGCTSCHQNGSGFRAPILENLYGSKVKLMDGSEHTVDNAYVREALLDPKAKVSAGYQPIMPSYEGLLTDDEIRLITEALKPLKEEPAK